MGVTIYDVAKRAKVSPSWVSWALRNHPRAQEIREETRERIRLAAKDLGYLKNISATTIRTGFNASTVVLLATENTNPKGNFALLSRLNAMGYGLRLYYVHELEKAFDEILANQLHYVICTLTMLEQRRRVAEFCRKHNIRAVFLGAGAVGMGFPTFAVDTRDEMHRLVNRFHELGHRKIALLCGQHRHCATEFRHQGYLDALAEHEIDEKMTFCQEFSTEPFLNFIEQERPTALACIDGMVATLALNALLRHGVNVPGEISILAITGAEMLPSILKIGCFTEPLGVAMTNALEYLLTGKCSAPLTENECRIVLESVYHPGETEGPPPEQTRYYNGLSRCDIFINSSTERR